MDGHQVESFRDTVRMKYSDGELDYQHVITMSLEKISSERRRKSGANLHRSLMICDLLVRLRARVLANEGSEVRPTVQPDDSERQNCTITCNGIGSTAGNVTNHGNDRMSYDTQSYVQSESDSLTIQTRIEPNYAWVEASGLHNNDSRELVSQTIGIASESESEARSGSDAAITIRETSTSTPIRADSHDMHDGASKTQSTIANANTNTNTSTNMTAIASTTARNVCEVGNGTQLPSNTDKASVVSEDRKQQYDEVTSDSSAVLLTGEVQKRPVSMPLVFCEQRKKRCYAVANVGDLEANDTDKRCRLVPESSNSDGDSDASSDPPQNGVNGYIAVPITVINSMGSSTNTSTYSMSMEMSSYVLPSNSALRAYPNQMESSEKRALSCVNVNVDVGNDKTDESGSESDSESDNSRVNRANNMPFVFVIN